MKAEKPATGISKIQEFSDSVCYRIECECTSHDHVVDTHIEVQRLWDDIPDISVMFYVTTYNKFPKNIRDRVKQAASILFTGVSKQEHEILLKPQAAKNWIQAVENSINNFGINYERKTD
jgi:hypothetical protein